MSNLKMFVVDIREDEYSILIFASNKENADYLATPYVIEDGGDPGYISARKWTKKGHEWIWNKYYPADGKPIVIACPMACEYCEKFGMEIGDDGLCDKCREDLEEEEEKANDRA